MAEIELTVSQERKIKNAVKALNDVRREIEKANPGNDINWYLEDSCNLNLMEGDSHDYDGTARQDRVIETFWLENSSGGGW